MLNQVQHDDRFSRNLMFCSFANKSNKTNTRTSFYSFAHFAHAHGMGIVGTWASVGKKLRLPKTDSLIVCFCNQL